MRNQNSNSIRTNLGSAAITLLGFTPTAQAEIGVDWFYSAYSEEKTNNQSRYAIHTQQLAIHGATLNDIALNVHYLHETMSGASPAYVDRGASDEPILVMSGASIQETRDDIRLDMLIPHESRKTSLSVGHSSENDYVARYASMEEQFDFNAGHTTLSVGASFSSDELMPTDADIYTDRVARADKNSQSIALSVSQIINRYSVAQLALAYTQLRGYLSDPYKQVLVDNDVLHDARPAERQQWVINGRYRQHLQNGDTLHLDYRLFDDDWDVRSHTLESAYYFNFDDGWKIIPSVRYYNQSRAYFYAPFYYGVRDDGFYSADYRLSPYGAVSYQLKAGKAFDGWSFNLSVERYTSDDSLALKNVVIENPALVDFMVIAAGVSTVF